MQYWLYALLDGKPRYIPFRSPDDRDHAITLLNRQRIVACIFAI